MAAKITHVILNNALIPLFCWPFRVTPQRVDEVGIRETDMKFLILNEYNKDGSLQSK